MSEAKRKAQEIIDALPRDHPPRPYCVTIRDRRGTPIDTRYVRASSIERAKATGLRVNRFDFKNRKSVSASAAPWGWRADANNSTISIFDL